jgi:predicted ATP-grasp superfamily ATP-dependent carboligase
MHAPDGSNNAVDVVLAGASVRAAAYSALRAGLLPRCLDLFGDDDLRAVCEVQTIPPSEYPHGFARLLDAIPSVPLIYTGALENHPAVLARLSRHRPLWGIAGDLLRAVRDPCCVHAALAAANLPALEIVPTGAAIPADGRWLSKPLAGASGAGVRFARNGETVPPGRYAQRFVAGDSGGAIFCGDGKKATLLGVTRQLLGLDWLHTSGFRYCGSVGPWQLPEPVQRTLTDVGLALASAFGLCGLFGVDFVLDGETVWLVEVNPRYTASIEVLEYATGLQALAWHRCAFASGEPPGTPAASANIVGKVILYASERLTIPGAAPWLTDDRASSLVELPLFADVPATGAVIERGRPILTLFARGATEAACLEALRHRACEVESILYGEGIACG